MTITKYVDQFQAMFHSFWWHTFTVAYC